MKILLVTNIFPNPDNKAAGMFVERTFQLLKESKHEVEIIHINGIKSFINYIIAPIRIFISCKKNRPDIIYSHFGLASFYCFFPWSIPKVFTYCGSDIIAKQSSNIFVSIKNKLITFFSNLSLYYCDHAIFVSDNLTKKAWNYNYATSSILPYPINTKAFKPIEKSEARQALNLDQSKRYILFPWSPLRSEKNFYLVKEVERKLQSMNINVSIIIPDTNNDDELNLYYNASDLLLLLSTHEGSPNVIKECIATSLPSISFDVGDVGKTISGLTNHFLIENRKIEDVIKTSIKILSNNSNILQSHDLDRVEKLWSSTIFIKNLNQIFKNVIDKKTT